MVIVQQQQSIQCPARCICKEGTGANIIHLEDNLTNHVECVIKEGGLFSVTGQIPPDPKKILLFR